MFQKLSVVLIMTAALSPVGVARAGEFSKPSWCHGGSGTNCPAADTAFKDRLEYGSRPYERAFASRRYTTPGIHSGPDPDCYAYSSTQAVPCIAWYAYRGRFYTVDAYVTLDDVYNYTASGVTESSFVRRTVTCPLGNDAEGQPIRGRLITNDGCDTSAAYFVGDEMSAEAGGVAHYTREVGWQFTDSGAIASSFYDAIGLYHCTNGSTIVCRDGAGDVFRYVKP